MEEKYPLRKYTAELHSSISRRKFVSGIGLGSLMLGMGNIPSQALARTYSPQPLLTGKNFDLSINYLPVNFTGRNRLATAINGSVPAPILRWREGDRVSLKVTNNLAHDSSIHWHGMILQSGMDGVPGLSFKGIKPGETFHYQFDVKQSGTYWYHSHSGFQEQTGMYGAIIIDPAEPEPVAYDREHVILLSDWSDKPPEAVYVKLEKMSHYYNFRERTVIDLWQDIKEKGAVQTWRDRAMWNQMRMSETDIADVTGYTYTYLMNGMTPDEDWKCLFKRGEKVRLRFINAAAMTIFDVRIPGLKMTVVTSDGQHIDPVTVDEFRIGVAETYDVIVEPLSDCAYTLFAQSIDRTGFTRGTLTPDLHLEAPVPEMDNAPTLGHSDMGMSHSPHHTNKKHQHHKHHSNSIDHTASDSTKKIMHSKEEYSPQVDMRVANARNGLYDPGIGLRHHNRLYGRRVLNYGDLHNYYPTQDLREPGRDIELHLTGNMNRYMWSIDGIKFADAEPLLLDYGERVRITLINDTMMTHPIHLHGMWSELETGEPKYLPRKHTVLVQPASKISYLVTADAPGRWAYHCHLLFHMPGMFREVRVR